VKRIGSILLWYVTPGLTLVGVVAYLLGATIGRTNPPIVPVQGLSMRPTLQAGDLIVLSGVDPARLRKGDVVAVTVPKEARSQYGLPSQIVHRIVRIGHDDAGLFFITKGDANSGADVFQTRPGDVVGKLRLDVPGAGYPFIFFRSRQGEVFLAVAGLVALLYFVIGLAERSAAPRTDEQMQELIAAVAEYGQHLRSHTAVMQNLAATTVELKLAAVGLGSSARSAPDSASRIEALRAHVRRLEEQLARERSSGGGWG
jgi:signal peptidase I